MKGAAGVALAAGVTAATLLVSPRAAAQQRIEVVPSVGMSETFSDNLDFTPSDQRSGFTTNVTPRLRIGAVGGRLEGFAQYALNLRYEHFSGGESSGLDHDASARLDYAVTPRWKVRLEDDFRLSPNPTQDIAFITPDGQVFRSFEQAARTPGVDVLDLRSIRQRRDQLRNRLVLGTSYDLTPRWSADADAVWSTQDSRDNVFIEDQETYGARVGTAYRLTPVDDVRVGLGYELTQFQRSSDATIARADAGWGRRLTETLRLGLTGGYALVRTSDGGADTRDEDLPYAHATLTVTMPEGGGSVRIGRDVGAGDGSGDISRRDLVELSASRALGASLSAGGRLAYLRSRSVRGIGTEADIFEGTVSLSWRFIRWASARASYRYRYEDPLGSAQSIDENSALVGLDVLWPVREMAGLRP